MRIRVDTCKVLEQWPLVSATYVVVVLIVVTIATTVMMLNNHLLKVDYQDC